CRSARVEPFRSWFETGSPRTEPTSNSLPCPAKGYLLERFRSWFDRLTTNGIKRCSLPCPSKGCRLERFRSWFDRLTTNGISWNAERNPPAVRPRIRSGAGFELAGRNGPDDGPLSGISDSRGLSAVSDGSRRA